MPVSEWLGRELGNSFFKERPIRVIKNGVGLDVFKPQQWDERAKYGISAKNFILGVASVWSDGKGLNDFVALNALLPVGKSDAH